MRKGKRDAWVLSGLALCAYALALTIFLYSRHEAAAYEPVNHILTTPVATGGYRRTMITRSEADSRPHYALGNDIAGYAAGLGVLLTIAAGMSLLTPRNSDDDLVSTKDR